MNKLQFRWVNTGQSPACILVSTKTDVLDAGDLSAADKKKVSTYLKSAAFTGAFGATAWVPGTSIPVLLAGIGKPNEFHAARWLRTWSAVARAALQQMMAGISFTWPEKSRFPLDTAALMKLAVEGLHEGSYDFNAFHPKKSTRTLTIELRGEVLAGKSIRRTVADGQLIGRTLNEIRDLANLPPNLLGPQELAAKVKQLAKQDGLDCRIWNEAALKKEKAGALLAVAQGSGRPGCLIRLAYTPGRKKLPPPLVVVGKAVTFDSGGICLKPGKGMEWMAYDKCGGMTALAAILLAARLKVPNPVVAYIPAVENMPDGRAARPGDIVTARNGTHIELLNTDAEGRLILADALSFAADEKPRAIVDIATLTGAVIIALGHEATAVMGNNDKLLLELMLSGESTGERLWQLPLWSEYDAALKGRFADVKNIGDGTAGTISGAAFLKQFVPEDIPWAHLDVAGTAWLEAAQNGRAPGATLSCARLLCDWLATTPGME